MDEMEKQIILRCSVCGNDQFSAIDETIDDIMNASEETEIKCSDCGKVTSKRQIIEDNQALINANIDDFEEDIIRQLNKDLKNIFR